MKYQSLCELVAGGERVRFKYASDLSRDEVKQLLYVKRKMLNEFLGREFKLPAFSAGMCDKFSTARESKPKDKLTAYDAAFADYQTTIDVSISDYQFISKEARWAEAYRHDTVLRKHPYFKTLDKCYEEIRASVTVSALNLSMAGLLLISSFIGKDEPPEVLDKIPNHLQKKDVITSVIDALMHQNVSDFVACINGVCKKKEVHLAENPAGNQSGAFK